MKESQKEEFLNWEDKVRDLYIKNFIPYWLAYKHWFSYWELDNDILIKALQNDIRFFLNTVWPDFSWEIKIIYKSWRPYFMNANFETANNVNTFEMLKKFINNFWFVGHKKYGDTKTTLYWEKIYKYSDKDWITWIEDDGGEIIDYIAKKNLK
jgi:hypothetical protein